MKIRACLWLWVLGWQAALTRALPTLLPGGEAASHGEFPAGRFSLDSAAYVELITEFGFLAGGGVRFEGTAEYSQGVPGTEARDMVFLLVCDEAAYESHLSGVATDVGVGETFCSSGAYRHSACISIPFNQSVSDAGDPEALYAAAIDVEFTVEAYSYLFLLVANCEVMGGGKGDLLSCESDPDSYCCAANGGVCTDGYAPAYRSAELDLRLGFTMCNADGHCIGYNDVGLLSLLPVQVIVWLLLAVVWARIVYLGRRFAMPLHTLMVAVPVFHAADRAVGLYELHLRDAGRRYDAYQPEAWLSVAALELVYRVVATASLLMLARGTLLVRRRLTACDRYYVALTVLAYGVGWGLYYIARPLDRSARTASVIVLPLALLNVACSMHTATSASIHRLAVLWRYPSAHPRVAALKMDVMRRFRLAYTFFILVTVLAGLPLYVAYRHSSVLRELVSDGSRVGLAVSIVFLFRPREALSQPILSFNAVLPMPRPVDEASLMAMHGVALGPLRSAPEVAPPDVVLLFPGGGAAFGVQEARAPPPPFAFSSSSLPTRVPGAGSSLSPLSRSESERETIIMPFVAPTVAATTSSEVAEQ